MLVTKTTLHSLYQYGEPLKENWMERAASEDRNESVKTLPRIDELIAAQCFRIAVVVQSEERVKKLRDFLHRPGRQNAEPIPNLTHLWIEAIPDFLTVSPNRKKGGDDAEETA